MLSGTAPEPMILARVSGMKGKTMTSRPSWSLNVSFILMIAGCDASVNILTSRAGLCGSTSRVSVMTFNATAFDL